MSEPASIEITPEVRIPLSELGFATSRSSGPGGQNVNKVETRVSLLFDIAATSALTEEQKERIQGELATRINKRGVLRISVQRHRTQAENRGEAVERFQELMARALSEDAERRPTRMPRAARRRRLENKRRKSDLKRTRGAPRDWNGG